MSPVQTFVLLVQSAGLPIEQSKPSMGQSIWDTKHETVDIQHVRVVVESQSCCIAGVC